jgi:hypothetical protein
LEISSGLYRAFERNFIRWLYLLGALRENCVSQTRRNNSRAGSAIVRKLGSEAAKQIEEAAAAAPKPAEPAPAKPAAPKPQTPKPDISKRPEGVPKDWKASPTKNGDGKIYQHPTEKGTYVKVEKGNPSASQPGQRYDNVRVQKNGKSYDKNGNVVPRRSRESHIPLEDFNPKNFNL